MPGLAVLAFAAHTGGRWNPPGSFGVLHLNLGEEVARANVERLFVGLPYSPEDLDQDGAPLLVEVTLPEEGYVDAATSAGRITRNDDPLRL